jgi:hypothetical protein
MDSAKSMGGGQYFKGEGRFLVRSKRMFVNQGHKGRFFVAEFEILASNSSVDPGGATRSWVSPLEGERAKYSFSDIKNLVFALTGKNPKDIGDPSENPKLHQEATQLVMAACDAEYAKKNNIDPTDLIGLDVKLETFSKATKKGGTFTVHAWEPAE